MLTRLEANEFPRAVSCSRQYALQWELNFYIIRQDLFLLNPKILIPTCFPVEMAGVKKGQMTYRVRRAPPSPPITAALNRLGPRGPIMSALSKKEQVALLLRNLYQDQHPDLAEIEVAGWTTLSKVMKADPNTINSLKNKDGDELGRALSEDDLEMLKYGISYNLQIERGVIAEVGLLDVDGILQKWPSLRTLVLKKNSRIEQMANLIRRSSEIKIPFRIFHV